MSSHNWRSARRRNRRSRTGRSSVVDRLKLLDIDSSFAARGELTTQPGCPAPLMRNFAHLNLWLHTTVLARIAANGGNVPQDLLD